MACASAFFATKGIAWFCVLYHAVDAMVLVTIAYDLFFSLHRVKAMPMLYLPP
jgi:hypothetical protein